MYFEDNVGVIVNPKREGKGSTADQKPLFVETADGNSNGIASGGAMKRNNGFAPDPRFAFDGLRPPLPWLDGLVFSYPRPVTSTSITSSISNANNVTALRNLQPYSHFMSLQHPRPMSDMGTAHGFMNRIWLVVDNKYKPRGRDVGFFGYGNENMDGLNELNNGPRAKSSKNQKGFAPSQPRARMFNPMDLMMRRR
ncbi:hypothetical protein CK203_099545 [Vitis vinifera]|uniref:Uncharacterized protein n=1 Tax=Vitis vinifera TaxID=29760 RepID=A0A438CJ12_VITVI|nr:hypothetical protein CK203_099545 [Vitis vinifera]